MSHLARPVGFDLPDRPAVGQADGSHTVIEVEDRLGFSDVGRDGLWA